MFFRQLSVQPLEPRYAPAITATLLDGDLIVTGDSADDEVTITKGGVLGNDLRVMEHLAGGGLNSSLFPGFTGDLIVALAGGNDNLQIRSFNYPGSLNLNLGSGNDTLRMQSDSLASGNTPPFPVAGSVLISGRDGNDSVSISRVDIAGDVLFYGGAGNDLIVVEAQGFGTKISGRLTADLSTGDDVVDFDTINVGSVRIVDPIGVASGSNVTLFNVGASDEIEMFLSILNDVVDIGGNNTGLDQATAYDLEIHTGLGNDRVDVDHMAMVNLSLFTGDGDEGNGFFGINLTNLTLFGQLHVDTGAGFDNLLINLVDAVSLRVTGGSGSDGFIVQNVTATDAVFETYDLGDVLGLHTSSYSGNVTVDLGDGHDNLYLSQMSVFGVANFDGGLGINTWHDLGGNAFGQLIRNRI